MTIPPMNNPTIQDVQGVPIASESAREAVFWLTHLMDDEATEQDRQAWLDWRNQHPDNERAWRHIESYCADFSRLNVQAAHSSLSVLEKTNRRGVLKVLAACCITGGGLILGGHSTAWLSRQADYQTGIGEQKSLTLEDGTYLQLNTQTAVNVRYSDVVRQIVLIQGEVMVESGHLEEQAHFPRPLSLETPQGSIVALGTRFNVHLKGTQTEVDVYQGAVRLLPQSRRQSLTITAGQGGWLSTSGYGRKPLIRAKSAWVNGQLFVDNQKLSDFLDELSRYRFGVVRCYPEASNLRLSGVFPLADTDRILNALPDVLPVQVKYFSRYWVQIDIR
ncbi:FecR family protein [Yersinia nurmii]|uniref:FecR family protein n=1 Tax=Yersinia nurmii TaxID=685706 RepID=A0AAW7K098_9GAMM|nr:FecR family protein [Yersinia nurmii]MDN0087386.1 FecR family protein [Yersinia nurmii]CNE93507.1 putative two-component system sensor protein [Yersinia nurmii]